ncbi:MAG TPA: leucyl aminopeptidase [Acidimicrobiales bacterium]|nr:leucyl aminopeptidase [Acidimicrobiales bacterium]
MPINFTTAATVPEGTEAVGVPVGANLDITGAVRSLSSPGHNGSWEELAAALERENARDFLASTGFRGEIGQTQSVLVERRHVVAVGTSLAPASSGAPGSGHPSTPTNDDLRRAGAALARASTRVRSVATTLHNAGDGTPASVQAVVEGVVLAGYRYRPSAATPEQLLEEVTLVGPPQAAAGARAGQIMAEASLRARRWADQPARELSPPVFAEAAAEAGAAAGLEVEIWDEERITAERLGCLASVASGSAQPPRLVRLSYAPATARAHLAFVGKGITFDSGGLSLKSPDAMETMKGDMGGAAAVVAALVALPELAPPVRVDGWAAMAENMPGGHATRPGDVVTARDGTAVEIVNTDAEGRLVLADALLVAGERHPDAIVDIATLTGGQTIALGPGLAALLGCDEIVDRVSTAAAAAGEPAWRLPLWAPYKERLDSEVADMRNVSRDRAASTIMAALFLQHFVKGIPWAHLDIAAPSHSERDEGWFSRGNTGWGARTLLQLATSWAM